MPWSRATARASAPCRPTATRQIAAASAGGAAIGLLVIGAFMRRRPARVAPPLAMGEDVDDEALRDRLDDELRDLD